MSIKLFEEKKVRTHWDATRETWLFSVIDVIQILTNSTIPKRYWSDLKKKLSLEGSEVYEKIVRFKLVSEDGKMRETDVADTESLFRIIQSIPNS
jgi:DNA-damage-inducible protein D